MPLAKCFDGMNIEELPVQVVILRGVHIFANLEEAQECYPTLDPENSSADFTWAMYGEVAPERNFAPNLPPGRYESSKVVALRFESWPVYNTLSV